VSEPPAFVAYVEGVAVVVVTAAQHFLDIVEDGITDCDSAVGDGVPMVSEDLL